MKKVLASRPFFAVTTALAITAIPILADGANPVYVYWLTFVEPFTSLLNIQEVLAKTTPLILTGLSVAIAFRVGYWNIGAEGSLYAGALMATWAGIYVGELPLSQPLVMLLGFTAGGLWALPWLWIKLRTGFSEIFTTLLMNYPIYHAVGAILSGPWRDPVSHWPQSPNIPPSAFYPQLLGSSRVHLGLLVGVLCAAALWALLEKTTWGLEIKAVGANPDAAHYAGMPVKVVMFWSVFLSGGLAGLSGVGEVLGVHHHLIQEISSGFGFTGIAVAMLANLNPWGVLLTAFFFGTINTGSRIAAMVADIPASLGQMISGVIIITAALSLARRKKEVIL